MNNTRIHYRRNYSRTRRIQDLVRDIQQNKVNELNLVRRKTVGKDGCLSVIEALHNNTSCRILNLKEKHIGWEGCVALASVLTNNSTLKILDLESNSIGSEGCITLANALQKNNSLEELELYNNGIGNAGAIALAAYLTKSTSLKKLKLGHNSIDDKGCIAISNALSIRTCPIELLYLYNNHVGDAGAIAIANALSKNTHSCLKQLDLFGNNEITESVGLRALADMIEKTSNPHLSHTCSTNQGCSLEFLTLDGYPKTKMKSKIQFYLKLGRLGLREGQQKCIQGNNGMDCYNHTDVVQQKVIKAVTRKSEVDYLSILYYVIRTNPVVCNWRMMDFDSDDDTDSGTTVSTDAFAALDDPVEEDLSSGGYSKDNPTT